MESIRVVSNTPNTPGIEPTSNVNRPKIKWEERFHTAVTIFTCISKLFSRNN